MEEAHRVGRGRQERLQQRCLAGRRVGGTGKARRQAKCTLTQAAMGSRRRKLTYTLPPDLDLV